MNGLVVLQEVIKKAGQKPITASRSNPDIRPSENRASNEQPNLGPVDMLNTGMAITPQGRQSGFAQIDLSGNAGDVNQWVQFDISNTTEGQSLANYPLRIGGYAGWQGTYTELGITSGAADTANVSDQIGANVPAVRGFSRMTVAKPVLVTEIQVTSEDSVQLNAEIKTLVINLDGSYQYNKINVSATQEKSDNRSDLLVVKGSWIMDANHCFEFSSRGGMDMTIKLKCEAWHNVGLFMPYGA